MDCGQTLSIILGIIFFLGYAAITFEHIIRVDKASTALAMAVIMWATYFLKDCLGHENSTTELTHHMAYVSQIIFFLLGALVIVEIINAHNGFSKVSHLMQSQSKLKMLWLVSFITFFLSAVLDNLTTTIVMVSLICQVLQKNDERLLYGGAIVIAANAGGAWTPIGDVTTTMLWIGNQISAGYTMLNLFLPSAACICTALLILGSKLKGNVEKVKDKRHKNLLEPHGTWVLILGMASLIFVPIFKITTGLPPFMGVFLGVAVLWFFIDMVHRDQIEREHLRMAHIFKRIDLSSIFFFTGILLSVDALQSSGVLRELAEGLGRVVTRVEVLATAIGLASAVVDNVPLVAATMGMYPLEQYPTDSSLWQLIAYCAGTGGSILVIGSAAGVVYMGMEKVTFIWYLRHVSLAAAAGYFAGILVYIGQTFLLGLSG